MIITPLANATSLTVPSAQTIGRSSYNFRQQVTPGPSRRGMGQVGNKATQSIVSELLLKAVYKSTKKAPKTFTLQDVDIPSVASLKRVIREQLKDDIVKEFDVGYYQSSTVVSIRSPQEVWNDLRKK